MNMPSVNLYYGVRYSMLDISQYLQTVDISQHIIWSILLGVFFVVMTLHRLVWGDGGSLVFLYFILSMYFALTSMELLLPFKGQYDSYMWSMLIITLLSLYMSIKSGWGKLHQLTIGILLVNILMHTLLPGVAVYGLLLQLVVIFIILLVYTLGEEDEDKFLYNIPILVVIILLGHQMLYEDGLRQGTIEDNRLPYYITHATVDYMDISGCNYIVFTDGEKPNQKEKGVLYINAVDASNEKFPEGLECNQNRNRK